jgi:two-component system NarL family sensor kinase
MPAKEYEIITGIVIAIVVLLLASVFILVLVINYNHRKRKHILEKQTMQSTFQQQLLQTQLEIQEQTFNDISQEIHDNVGQILSLAKVQINIMTEGNEMNPEMLNDVKNNIGKAMSDLRDIAKSLSSERIKTLTIHSAVFNEAERISNSGIIRIQVNVDGGQKELNQQKKLVLFRIVQESMQNIIKHANATEIAISFHYAPDMLRTVIKDNGKGFELRDALQNSTGLGLSNIRSRALIAGGRSVIESSPNAGTTITINMPYE